MCVVVGLVAAWEAVISNRVFCIDQDLTAMEMWRMQSLIQIGTLVCCMPWLCIFTIEGVFEWSDNLCASLVMQI